MESGAVGSIDTSRIALWSLVPLVSVLSGGEGYPLPPVILGTAAVAGTAVATAAGLAGSGRALVAVMAGQAALLLALTSPAALPIGSLELRVGATPSAPPRALAARIEATLADLIDATPTGETVTIGIFTLGEATALTTSFPPRGPGPAAASPPCDPSRLPAPERPDDRLDVVDLGEQQVLEATWGCR